MSGVFTSAAAGLGLDLASQLVTAFVNEPFTRTAAILRCDPELVRRVHDHEENQEGDGEDKSSLPCKALAQHEFRNSLDSTTSAVMPLRGLRRTMKHIYQTEGLGAFWRGFFLQLPYLQACSLMTKWGQTCFVYFLPHFKLYTDLGTEAALADEPLPVRNSLLAWYVAFLLVNFGVSFVSTLVMNPLLTLYTRYVTDRVGHTYHLAAHHKVTTSTAPLEKSLSRVTRTTGYRYKGIKDLIRQTIGYTDEDDRRGGVRRLSFSRLYEMARALYRGFWLDLTLAFLSTLIVTVTGEFSVRMNRYNKDQFSASSSTSTPETSSSRSAPDGHWLFSFSLSDILFIVGCCLLVLILMVVILAPFFVVDNICNTIIFRRMVATHEGEDGDKSSRGDGDKLKYQSSSWVAFRTIVRQEGWPALFRGLGTTLLGGLLSCLVVSPLFPRQSDN